MKKVFSLLTVLFFWATIPLLADSVPRMDKEVLKSQLSSKNLLILDVRQDGDWNTSEMKIKGAVRVNDEDLSFAVKLPKDVTIVLYCA